MKNIIDIDIQQLLAERPFELLASAEKEAVLSQMPEWEYQRLHQLVQRSKAALKSSPKPNPAIREQLLLALRNQPVQQQQPKRPASLIVRLAQYRLPVWQAAAGLALLLVANFALKKTTTESVRTETVYVNTTDTVFKEVVALPVADTASKTPERRVNVKPRLAGHTIPAEAISVEAVADSSSRQQRRLGDLPGTLPDSQFSFQQPTGRSANEMMELWQFLGEVY